MNNCVGALKCFAMSVLVYTSYVCGTPGQAGRHDQVWRYLMRSLSMCQTEFLWKLRLLKNPIQSSFDLKFLKDTWFPFQMWTSGVVYCQCAQKQYITNSLTAKHIHLPEVSHWHPLSFSSFVSINGSTYLTLCWVSEILSFYPEALCFSEKEEWVSAEEPHKKDQLFHFKLPDERLGKWEHFNMLVSNTCSAQVCTIIPSKLLSEREMLPFKELLCWLPKGHVMKF